MFGVRGDRALRDLSLRLRSLFDRRRVLGLVVPADLVPDLLGTLIAEVGAAQHQDERDGPGMKAPMSSSRSMTSSAGFAAGTRMVIGSRGWYGYILDS
jgi:hypothetical protein